MAVSESVELCPDSTELAALSLVPEGGCGKTRSAQNPPDSPGGKRATG